MDLCLGACRLTKEGCRYRHTTSMETQDNIIFTENQNNDLNQNGMHVRSSDMD